MEDLIAWLRDVLDQDEAMVGAAIVDDCDQDGGFEGSFDRLTKGREVAGPLAFEPSFGEAAARMIVWNTPRRALATIRAHRAIVDGYAELAANPARRTDPLLHSHHHLLRRVVLTLAPAYADRPGYREEWKP